MNLSNERVVYLNGEFVPESRAFIHFRDRGFIFGDAVFDTARTFDGTIFRLEEHLERLMRSLRYLRIDPGLCLDDYAAITEDCLQRNRHLLGPDDDYWVYQRVTRGSSYPDGPGARAEPTVIVECRPLPFAERAVLYRDGVDIRIPSVRRTPPESLSPNAKMNNYLNLVVAGFEAEGERAWPILLDTRGFLNEGSGSNVFIVRDGEVLTPKEAYVLAGVTRGVVFELCERLGIPCREADIAPYDGATADEVFISSTSLCICPASGFNGQPVGAGTVPGPVTRRLMDAFSELVRCDYVAQYLKHLPALEQAQ